MTHKANGHLALVERRRTADLRTVARSQISTDDQIIRLDARLGAGIGAKKERARLAGTSKPVRKTRRGKNTNKENAK